MKDFLFVAWSAIAVGLVAVAYFFVQAMDPGTMRLFILSMSASVGVAVVIVGAILGAVVYSVMTRDRGDGNPMAGFRGRDPYQVIDMPPQPPRALPGPDRRQWSEWPMENYPAGHGMMGNGPGPAHYGPVGPGPLPPLDLLDTDETFELK